VNAVYGGEASAHHYFRDFAYCDSGMIPWLMIIEYLGTTKKSLVELVAERRAKFPCSEEINFEVGSVEKTIAHVSTHYRNAAFNIDLTDGLSMEFPAWRFNLRGSNTEALLRLNLETRSDAQLVAEKAEELSSLINGLAS
jgi:phosphomannomutase / phosphoglucomutase